MIVYFTYKNYQQLPNARIPLHSNWSNEMEIIGFLTVFFPPILKLLTTVSSHCATNLTKFIFCRRYSKNVIATKVLTMYDELKRKKNLV
jgi:membrane protein YqaA with SNARE-associated domain